VLSADFAVPPRRNAPILVLPALLLLETLPARAQVGSLDEARVMDGTVPLGRIKAVRDDGFSSSRPGQTSCARSGKLEIRVILLASGTSASRTRSCLWFTAGPRPIP